jgi:hypothetical protein
VVTSAQRSEASRNKAAPLHLPRADRIDHGRTHDARRIRHELPAVADAHRARLVEAQTGLMHQRGRVEQRERDAASNPRMGPSAQSGRSSASKRPSVVCSPCPGAESNAVT